jgi:hypothetical protein
VASSHVAMEVDTTGRGPTIPPHDFGFLESQTREVARQMTDIELDALTVPLLAPSLRIHFTRAR